MPAKKALRLSRRTLLRGAGGVMVGLPLLECMLDGGPARAQTATAPKRYLVVFDGQSLGGDDDTLLSEFIPETVGAGYDLKTALAPLGLAGFTRYDPLAEEENHLLHRLVDFIWQQLPGFPKRAEPESGFLRHCYLGIRRR